MKYLAVILALFMSFKCYGQYNAEITLISHDLDGKKIEFTVQDNKGINPLSAQSKTFSNNAAFFHFNLTQPSNMARIDLSVDGKSLTYPLAIDSGKSSLNLRMENNRLSISGYESRGNKLKEEMSQLFATIIKKYREESGNNEAKTLPSDLIVDFRTQSLNLLESNPKNYFSLIALYQISKTDKTIPLSTKVISTLGKLDSSLQLTALGKQIFNENNKVIESINAAKTGKDVLYFTIDDIIGKPFTNKNLLGQNYILAFSATWCVPCQSQLPKLQKIYQQYKSKGLKVVYFNDDNNVAVWKKHVNDHKLNWINVSERQKPGNSKIQKSFGIYAIPSYLIINKAGKIVYNSDENDIGLDKFAEKIKELYRQQFK